MPENIHAIFKGKIVPVRFERTMGLLGATTLGVGALMGSGIYVLIGLAAGEVGPGAWLSYLICGLLSILSVLMFGELSRRVPVTGGAYAYAYNAIGSFWGFATGWLLVVLGGVLASAAALRMLYRKSAAAPANRFKRHIPELAFVANLGLLLTIDWVSLLFGLQLAVIGCFLYLLYSRRREIRSRTGMSVVLTGEKDSMFHVGSRILVPMANPQTQSALFGMSDALLAGHGGEITFLNVLPANYTGEQKSHSSKILVEAIQRHAARALYRIELASSDEPLEFLVKRSAEFDLLILGTTKVGLLERVAVGSFSSQIVGRSECSVAVVKVARPVKKLLPV